MLPVSGAENFSHPLFALLPRRNRQGSFRTKERYCEAVKRFCAFPASQYHLQKLSNISGKRLTAYVLHMQERSDVTDIYLASL